MTAPPPPSRSGQSFRVALGQLTAALVLITAACIGVVAYVNSSANVRALSASVYASDATYAAARASDYAATAEHTLALTHRLVEAGELSTELDALGTYFVHVLRSNPRLSTAGWGDEEGNAIWATRNADGTMVVERYTEHSEGRSRHEQFQAELDGRWTPLVDQGSDYDPRVRPWYTMARSADGPRWTEPYLFVPENLPGISMTRRVDGPAGQMLGVLTVDFELSFLSAALEGLDHGDGAKGVIFDAAGYVLGHSDPAATRVEDPDGQLRIARVDDHPDPILRLLAEVPAQERQRREPTLHDVEHDGERYAVAVHAADIGLDEHTTLSWRTAVVVPEAVLLADVRTHGLYSLVIAAIGLVLTVGLSVAFSRWLTRSFYAFYEEMQRVGDLDLEDRALPATRITEVHRLGERLEAMKLSLRSFERYVPAALVRELVASGIEARPGGESREVTVLFTDVAGFTTISEQLAAQELAVRLGHHLEVLSAVIQEERGTVDKYIGDAIMAFWNAPKPVPDHAVRACRAGLRMLEAVRTTADSEQPLWDIRVGINTSTAVVGNLGSERRLDYTAIGDGVNLASRLEGQNKQYGTRLLVGAATVAQLGGQMLVRPVDRVVVKGQSREEEVYEVMADGEGDADQRALAAATSEAFAAFVDGRLDQAAAAYRRCLELHPGDGVAEAMLSRIVAG